MFSFVNWNFSSDDISNIAFYDVIPAKLRYGSLLCFKFCLIAVFIMASDQNICRIYRLRQSFAAEVIVSVGQRDAVFTAEIIHHCKKVKTLCVPSESVKLTYFVLFQSFYKEINIPHAFYTVADLTFEQFEIRTHKRMIDIIEPTAKTVDELKKLNLPAGVEVKIDPMTRRRSE